MTTNETLEWVTAMQQIFKPGDICLVHNGEEDVPCIIEEPPEFLQRFTKTHHPLADVGVVVGYESGNNETISKLVSCSLVCNFPSVLAAAGL
tara:strand:- start:4583 stop:4858 length:276 start_codon:yes stop_codon:yes gene_type:complete